MAQMDVCSSSVDATKSQYIDYNTQSFKKTDKQFNQELLGAEFAYSSLDNQVLYYVRMQYENGFYRIPAQSKNVNVSDASLFLPSLIRNAFDSIQTYDDYLEYIDDTAFGLGNDCLAKERGQRTEMVHMVIPVKFHEIKSPVGYQKSDMITWANANLIFRFNEEGNLLNKNVLLEFSPYFELFEYDASVSYESYVTSEYSFLDYLYDEAIYSAYKCDGSFYDEPIEVRKSRYCYEYYPVIEDEKGDVSLKIDNTVEDQHEISISKDSTLKSKVLITNTGNASSGNNIIETILPEEIVVDPTSISDHGVYHKDTHRITWNLDYFDSNAQEDFTFKIIVDGDQTANYQFYSTITSDQIEERVSSPEAMIHVLNNPKTSCFSLLFFILFLFVSLLSFLHVRFIHPFFQ